MTADISKDIKFDKRTTFYDRPKYGTGDFKLGDFQLGVNWKINGIILNYSAFLGCFYSHEYAFGSQHKEF